MYYVYLVMMLKSVIPKLKERLKQHFIELTKIHTSPHSIAVGFALGTFIAILPIPGFHILLALLIVFIYENINKVALFAAFIVWNPFMLPFVYYLSFK